MNSRPNKQALQTEQLIAAQQSIHAVRESILETARELSEEFITRRDEASKGEFSGLNLQVRSRYKGRGVSIYWVVYYFRGRRKTGSSMVDRRKGEQDFDLSAIRAAAPDWLKEIACDIEMRSRPLREALVQLKDAEWALRTTAARLGITLTAPVSQTFPPAAFDPASNDDHDWELFP